MKAVKPILLAAVISSVYVQDAFSIPTEQEAQSLIAVCAASRNIEVTGEIRGAISDVFEGGGVEANRFGYTTVPSFLMSLPESQKFAALELYHKCIRDILTNNGASTDTSEPPVPASFRQIGNLNVTDLGDYSGTRFYDYKFNFEGDEEFYWIIVENENKERWLQDGGQIGNISMGDDSNRFSVAISQWAFPATIYAAGFSREDYEALQMQTSDINIWLLDSNRVKISSTSNICYAGSEGEIIQCE